MLAITPETGQFLHSLLVGIGARDALELGTSTGYSTLWFADALLANHRNPAIITIEGNPAKAERARANFKRARVSDIISIRCNDIMDVLRGLPAGKKFDFVFIDADKENIIEYADLVLPHLRTGGIMATDNMLYPRKYRRIMKEYSEYLAATPGIQTCTVAVGNGQEITVKALP